MKWSILFLFLLAGCSNSFLSAYEADVLKKACESHGGLAYYDLGMFVAHAKCVDGLKVSIGYGEKLNDKPKWH